MTFNQIKICQPKNYFRKLRKCAARERPVCSWASNSQPFILARTVSHIEGESKGKLFSPTLQ